MHKTTTSSNKTDFKTKQQLSEKNAMLPSEETLKKILQFASSYRTQTIGGNQFIEMNLN
ncbi:MAG: hypothetical protein ACOYM7_01650 [Paludibacter sp.]